MVGFQLEKRYKELNMIKKYAFLCFVINITFVYAILGGVGINVSNDDFTVNEIL